MVFISLLIVMGNSLLIDWQLHYKLSDQNSEKDQSANPTIQKLNVGILFS